MNRLTVLFARMTAFTAFLLLRAQCQATGRLRPTDNPFAENDGTLPWERTDALLRRHLELRAALAELMQIQAHTARLWALVAEKERRAGRPGARRPGGPKARRLSPSAGTGRRRLRPSSGASEPSAGAVVPALAARTRGPLERGTVVTGRLPPRDLEAR